MRVESRDLIDLGQSEPHLGRQCGKVSGREMAIAVLNEVQVLDQQIAPTLAVAKQRTDLFARLGIDLPTLWRARGAASAGIAATFGRHDLRRVVQCHHFLLKRQSVSGNRLLRPIHAIRTARRSDRPCRYRSTLPQALSAARAWS